MDDFITLAKQVDQAKEAPCRSLRKSSRFFVMSAVPPRAFRATCTFRETGS
ncbi:hypothetical protein [Burkholderia arboris]|uniref:hypothetical protein n=1 Tax=Burkholderia arboris TaxID=488730 RepID=UPI00210D2F80|nr:hypothetical protein [Burkholderia arboris]UTV60076.1 hypothetical protein NLX30_38485 [Burkholderia arboris]